MAVTSYLFDIKNSFAMNIIPVKVWDITQTTGSLIDVPEVTLFIKHLNVARNLLFCFVLFCFALCLFVCLFV